MTERTKYQHVRSMCVHCAYTTSEKKRKETKRGRGKKPAIYKLDRVKRKKIQCNREGERKNEIQGSTDYNKSRNKMFF